MDSNYSGENSLEITFLTNHLLVQFLRKGSPSRESYDLKQNLTQDCCIAADLNPYHSIYQVSLESKSPAGKLGTIYSGQTRFKGARVQGKNPGNIW